MTAPDPSFWRRGGIGHSIFHVNALSFLCQAVQLGTVPALIALRLNAAGYSVAAVGLIAAAPWIMVMILGRWVPRLIVRYRYTLINAMALAVSALAVVTLIFTENPVGVFTANLCLGLGLILRWIACDSWIIELAPEPIRGRAIGIHETLMGCGIAAGPLVILLCGSQGPVPLLICLGFLLLAAFALLCVRSVESQNPPAMAEGPDFEQPASKAELYLCPMIVAALIAGFTETSSVSFLPILSQHGHWAIASTLALGAFTLGGTLLQFPLGCVADRLGFRATQIITAAIISSASVTLVFTSHSFAVLLPALFVLGGACGGMNTLAVIEAGASYPSDQISAAAARVALAYTVGSIIGPPVLGELVSIAGPVWFPYAFATAGCAFCVFRLFERKRVSI